MKICMNLLLGINSPNDCIEKPIAFSPAKPGSHTIIAVFPFCIRAMQKDTSNAMFDYLDGHLVHFCCRRCPRQKNHQSSYWALSLILS